MNKSVCSGICLIKAHAILVHKYYQKMLFAKKNTRNKKRYISFILDLVFVKADKKQKKHTIKKGMKKWTANHI